MKTIHANISQSAIKAKNDYRDSIDLLRSRINLLAGKDKLLMTMYLENGNSFMQLAQLAGVDIGCMSRRIRKVIRRLTEGEYIICLRNREKFTSTEMAIAKDYFLRGLSLKKISEEHQCTFYSVRKTMQEIQQQIKTVSNKPRTN